MIQGGEVGMQPRLKPDEMQTAFFGVDFSKHSAKFSGSLL
jgi:hypothetical protein